MNTSAFTFRALQNTSAFANLQVSSLDLPEPSVDDIISRLGNYGTYLALLRGALIRLFGSPLFSSVNIDEAFTYFVEVTNAEGKVWRFAIYQTSSGIDIGGDFEDFSNREAARKLQELILSTAPADFEETLYDSSSGNKVIYGCHSGSCYWRE